MPEPSPTAELNERKQAFIDQMTYLVKQRNKAVFQLSSKRVEHVMMRQLIRDEESVAVNRVRSIMRDLKRELDDNLDLLSLEDRQRIADQTDEDVT